MGVTAAVAAVVSAAAAVGSGIDAREKSISAKKAAAGEKREQQIFAAQANAEQNRQSKIETADVKRTTAETAARRKRSATGAGDLLTSGDTGIMNAKTKLGE